MINHEIMLSMTNILEKCSVLNTYSKFAQQGSLSRKRVIILSQPLLTKGPSPGSVVIPSQTLLTKVSKYLVKLSGSQKSGIPDISGRCSSLKIKLYI